MSSSRAQNLELLRGSRIRAKVLELQAGGDLLVSYQGHLIRVKNQTDLAFKVNDTLNLQVVGLSPLEFKIQEKTAILDRMI